MIGKKKILALVNPISGTDSKAYVPELLQSAIDSSLYDLDVRFTQRPNHAFQLSRQAVDDGYFGVLAVGGDGTVNEVASALCNSHVVLGILPDGSGNGLARHLGIPIDIRKAIEVVNAGNVADLDYCTANGKHFFCTCGVGFDASVSAAFAKGGKRGPVGYLKSAILEYLKYRSQEYRIVTPKGVMAERAFLIACGNASQYGNNAYIAPNADMQDGLIDVTVILPITPLDTAVLGLLLFAKHIDQDTNIISFRTPSLRIERKEAGVMHLDGEAMMMPAMIDIVCHPKGLRAFVPTKMPEKPKLLSSLQSGFWDFVNSVRGELNV